MTSGYDALTEKEKQTLRLLLDGHDAKSLARSLGLSVHTIHERLRDARRKLAVSSSREAARMLREIEGAAPQSVGDKGIGDDPGGAAAHSDEQPAPKSGERRRAGWIIGGLAMTISLALLALSSLSGGGAPTAVTATRAAVSPTSASEAAAVEAARDFLAKVDRQDWEASWRATHKSFQLLNTADWWAKASQQVRERVGAVQSRELATVDFTPAPPNGYWVVTFKARYSKAGYATETLQMASQNGGWKLAGIAVE